MYNRAKHQTQTALGPAGHMEVFHQSCANKDICVFLSERFVLGFQSFPKPLAFCLSACLSHVGAALREGEDFSLGIVGREGVLAGLCV